MTVGIMRNAFLWASRNAWLDTQFRRRAFAQRAVRRFMPGEDVTAALDAADSLQQHRITTLLTVLGENVSSNDEAADVLRHYFDVLDRVGKVGLESQISVKPTQLGLDLSAKECAQRIEGLVRRAGEVGNFVWMDMESSKYVDRTIEIFEHCRKDHDNVGLCIQAYLLRCDRDLERLVAGRSAIRLVKGAYDEPEGVAYQQKQDVDDKYFEQAVRLLNERQNGNSGLPAIATHDMPLLRRILERAAADGVPRDKYEIQMLYGIGREHQRTLAAEGYRMRVLISYGAAWFPWYMRRLAERPANVWFVLKNLVRR